MDVYSLFIIIAAVLSMVIPKTNIAQGNLQNRNKKYYCFILGFLLFMIAALRATSVGFDSGQYARHFYNIQQLDFNLISNLYEKELIFYYAVKLLTYITSHHQWMFAAIGGVYAYSISRFIYKYSKDPMVSFIMLIPMMYFAFTLSGLRQTIAITIVLFSYDYILRKRLLKFILTVIIASLFHQSALLFLPAYFISNKKLNSIKVILGFPVAFIVFAFRSSIVSLVQIFIYEHYSFDHAEGAGGWITLLVYFLIIIVAAVFSKQIKNEYFPFFFKMMYLGALIQMFVPLQPNIFRVSMYYNIASIILIPDILESQKDKVSKLIAYSLFFILMGIQYYIFTYYAAGAQPYKFFWQ